MPIGECRNHGVGPDGNLDKCVKCQLLPRAPGPVLLCVSIFARNLGAGGEIIATHPAAAPPCFELAERWREQEREQKESCFIETPNYW